ncbi:MAG: tetratricopeptide repeat protein, partial [Pedobacter sp.]
DYEGALRAFDYATLIDDSFLGAFLEKAKSLEKLKRYEEAIECYNTTMELDDPTSFALLRVGKCYERLGNAEKALKFYLKTVHEDPLLDKAWIAITDFYIRRKNHQKALYYVNKAISIDNENKLYWKRYAVINKALDFHEEAEEGYRKAVEFGDYQLDTWLFWTDTLQFLGENDAAINTLLQAAEYYTEEYQIEYRLAGLYFMTGETDKAIFHLSDGMRQNFKNHSILKEQFPIIWDEPALQEAITRFKKKK